MVALYYTDPGTRTLARTRGRGTAIRRIPRHTFPRVRAAYLTRRNDGTNPTIARFELAPIIARLMSDRYEHDGTPSTSRPRNHT
jgi:hypothetical protein